MLFFSILSKKPIMIVLKSKLCNVCMENTKKLNLSPHPPDIPTLLNCIYSHEGTSISMEALVYCKGLHNIFNNTGVIVYGLVGNDDLSFRANIQNNWKEKFPPTLSKFYRERLAKKNCTKGKDKKNKSRKKIMDSYNLRYQK